jgi:nucleotide-binding universal stress UspA family protein
VKILAILTSAESVATCLDAATMAAGSLGVSALEVLYVVVDPRHIVAAPEEIDFQLLRETREGTAAEREQSVRAEYEKWMASRQLRDLAIEWKEVFRQEEAGVLEEAQSADVLILVQAGDHNLDAGDARHAAIFRSGKPLLMVPSGWRAPENGAFRRIAIGISRGEAAAHAIAAAKPLIVGAERILALRVGEDAATVPEAVELLGSWGVATEVQHVPATGNIGECLVAAADEAQADLLVVGAYRHSEVLEWAMRSTTRQILKAADLPLLLMH